MFLPFQILVSQKEPHNCLYVIVSVLLLTFSIKIFPLSPEDLSFRQMKQVLNTINARASVAIIQYPDQPSPQILSPIHPLQKQLKFQDVRSTIWWDFLSNLRLCLLFI